jgi:hypothetical protein
MWINQEVELPQALITAQRDGQLVVFAGAGVSMGAPSNLPSFETLASEVAGGVIARKENEAFDAFLGRVEEKQVDVQTRTRARIGLPGSEPRSIHRLIVELFRSEEAVRIVTTNFDRHFTTTARERYPRLEVFTAPALPLGRECYGLIYLHGSVDELRSRLVLTDADFGRAYLTDGWATRFLTEMFLKFTVLFIGYSHQDPVMKYLARSFVGSTARFALTRDGDDGHWTGLGITPVHFPERPAPERFGAIDAALESWTRTARMGAFDHQARIVRMVSTPPSLDPEAVDYMRSVLADPVTLPFFTGSARLIEWFHWANSEGFFAPLVSGGHTLTTEQQTLALWFAEHIVLAHQNDAVAFVQQHASTLNPFVSEAIAFHLGRVAEVSTESLRLWSAALLAVNSCPTSALTRLIRKCSDAGATDTAALLFRFLLRPRLQFERPWLGAAGDGTPRLNLEIALSGEAYELREAWTRTILPNLGTLYRQLLPMITDYLNDAWALLRAAGRAYEGWDPLSHARSSIEAHEQDRIVEDWFLLVDVARDTLEWALTNDASLAVATISAWSVAPPKLLTRLAIHGTGRRIDITPEGILAEVREREWLFKYKKETFALLATVFPNANDEAKRLFIDHSMAAEVFPVPPDDPDAQRTVNYERYNLAVWLHTIAPASTIATDHFNELQGRYQDFTPREYPDLDHWITAGGFVGPQSPLTPQQLVAMGVPAAVTYLAEYAPEPQAWHGPDRSGLLTIFERSAADNLTWSFSVTDEMIRRHLTPGELWSALLGAWRTATLDDGAYGRIVRLLDEHPHIGENALRPTASFVLKAAERSELTLEELEPLERIGERLLPMSDATAAGVYRNGQIDWFTSAVSHPGGEVALAWLVLLARRMTLAGDEWRGLPESSRERFRNLLGGGGNNSVLARVVFASRAHFLFQADRVWTVEHIVPLFDWEANVVRAEQAWKGFLASSTWNAALFERMQPFLLQTFDRIAELGDQENAFISRLAAVAAFSPADPWRNAGWVFELMRRLGPEHRKDWAREFGLYVESLATSGADALWERWVSDYWAARLTGVPQPLADGERMQMITWVWSFRGHLAEATRHVLEAPPVTLNHYTFHHLRHVGMAESNGFQTGRLLRGLLHAAGEIEYDTGELLEFSTAAFRNGAEPGDLLAVAEDMARLRCHGAEALRELVSAGIAPR